MDSAILVDPAPARTVAAFHGHVSVVRGLLKRNAEANSQDNDVHSPLHNVMQGDRFNPKRAEIVQLLLKHDANPNARDLKLKTPLHLVSERAILLDVLRLLLEHGADLEGKDNDGKTPLRLSFDRGHDDITRLLSEYSNKPISGSLA